MGAMTQTRDADQFAAMVRIGDSEEDPTSDEALETLRLHVREECWSSPPGRVIRRGLPVIASHVGEGRGWFLLGVFTGETIDIPWPRAPHHATHVGHEVRWMDGLFLGDADAIPGAKGRHLRWLTRTEFSVALRALTVDTDYSPLIAGR